MPRYDWTWPMGQWPWTGRRQWNCKNNDIKTEKQESFFKKRFWWFWKKLWWKNK